MTVSSPPFLAAANAALPVFEEVVTMLVNSAEIDPGAPVMFEGAPLPIDTVRAPGRYFSRLTIAPLKGEARSEQKVVDEYGGDASLLVDVVRCSIVVDTEAELIAVANPLAAMRAPSQTQETVRLKNRFSAPLL